MKNRRQLQEARRLSFSLAMLFTCCLCSPATQAAGLADWWQTPDQQGQKLFDNGEFAAAAVAFENSLRKGAASYRAGDFEQAAAIFARIRTPQAAYNRGNALVMLGRYEEAIQSYEQALQMQPGWTEALQNRDIALARKQLLAPPESDAGGTGGKMAADEFVFDDTGRVDRSGQEQVTDGEEVMSDQEMRAVWLRRVQNDPADFLRARFSYQLYRDTQQEQAGD